MEKVLPLAIGFGVAGAAYGVQFLRRSATRWTTAPKNLTYAKRFYDGPFYSTMTKREAALVLGCRQTAEASKILDRYRVLMRLNHPDLGGSPFVAQKINEAKELLIKSKKQ